MNEARIVYDKGVSHVYGVNFKSLNQRDIETIKYALDNYGFVNKKYNSYYFDVTIKDWIDNIVNNIKISPKINEVLTTLKKIA